MNYQKDDLIKLLEDKQILEGIFLKKGTLVYVNDIQGEEICVSETNSDYSFWISSINTTLIERISNN